MAYPDSQFADLCGGPAEGEIVRHGGVVSSRIQGCIDGRFIDGTLFDSRRLGTFLANCFSKLLRLASIVSDSAFYAIVKVTPIVLVL